MERLAQLRGRLGQRTLCGFAAYWGANAALVLAEAHWHFLYHLTILDIALIRTMLAPTTHVH